MLLQVKEVETCECNRMGKAQIINCVVYVWAFVLTLLLPWVFTTNISGSGSCPVHEFHGGNPNGFASGLGSCFCGKDSYCLCTPSLAIDAIVEVKSILNEVSVVLVVRKDSTKKQYAIPGCQHPSFFLSHSVSV